MVILFGNTSQVFAIPNSLLTTKMLLAGGWLNCTGFEKWRLGWKGSIYICTYCILPHKSPGNSGNTTWPSTTLKSVKPGEPGNVCMWYSVILYALVPICFYISNLIKANCFPLSFTETVTFMCHCTVSSDSGHLSLQTQDRSGPLPADTESKNAM